MQPEITSSSLIDTITQHPLVPVFYHADAYYAGAVMRACYDGGVRVFEFTNRGSAALVVFRELVAQARAHCPGLALGVGTILTADSAHEFAEAGADFIVQPVTTNEVGAACRERGLPWIPAGATLNEIYSAITQGADLVKLFPGNVIGPDFVKAVLGPIPDLKLMVTGGVEPTAESLTAWFKSGVTAVGLGSQLFSDRSQSADQLRERVAGLFPHVQPFIPKP